MRRVTLAAVAVLMLAGAAAGFGPDRGPDLWRDLDFEPVVGNWAEYEMTPTGEKPMKMKISIVGKEDEAFWYETVMTDPEGRLMINKMLVSGDPGDEDNVKRMIVKPGDQPAMEMPMQMMQMGMMGEPDEEEEEPEGTMDDLGTESVTVPAGTFDAKHWQFASEGDTFDAWVKSGVGPYGLIKSSAPEFVMVLVAHGDDAKTAITEEPQKMPAMGGFPMGGMGGE